jgi:hypothetical protein
MTWVAPKTEFGRAIFYEYFAITLFANGGVNLCVVVIAEFECDSDLTTRKFRAEIKITDLLRRSR